MKSHKGNSVLLLFIPELLFLFFFFFFILHSTYSGLFCRRGTRREEQGAQEMWTEQWHWDTWSTAEQFPFWNLGILEAPQGWWGCKHTAPSASFPSTPDSDVPLSRWKEGSAHSQPCRPDRALPPLQEQLSSHLGAPAAHQGQLKMHIPKGQQWNLLCWSEIWYLLSFFQVSPLKPLQILAPSFFKRVWKQFFGRKCFFFLLQN